MKVEEGAAPGGIHPFVFEMLNKDIIHVIENIDQRSGDLAKLSSEPRTNVGSIAGHMCLNVLCAFEPPECCADLV